MVKMYTLLQTKTAMRKHYALCTDMHSLYEGVTPEGGQRQTSTVRCSETNTTESFQAMQFRI